MDNSITIDYYTKVVPKDISVFIKRKAQATLAENYAATLAVERDMLSIGAIDHEGRDDHKPIAKKGQSATNKTTDKDKDAFDFESIAKTLKQLTNEVSDLKRKGIESTTSAKAPKPFFRKRNPNTSRPPSNPNTVLNVE